MRAVHPLWGLSLAVLVSTVHAAPTPGARAVHAARTRAARTRPASGEQVAVFETTQGKIAIQLFPADAPKTVANFRKLIAAGFYDSLTFHRIAPGFVIQGGDPNSRDDNPFNDGNGGPGYTLPAEIQRKHEKGAVAMARMPDPVNPQRESNGSQFYIALRELPHLDGQYTVFGKVIAGWDTIDRLVALAGHNDIARVGENANPGKLSMILHARLEPLSRWAGRRPAKATPAAADSTRR